MFKVCRPSFSLSFPVKRARRVCPGMMESAYNALGLFTAALVIIAAYVVYSYAYRPYQLLKKFGFKGPRPVAFFGHYRLLRKLGWLKFYEEMYQRYGLVCGFYIGRKPHLMVADVEMLKHITVKEFNTFMDRPSNIQDLLYKAAGTLPELAFTKGETWKRARQSLSPSFSAMKLKMMVPVIKKSCDVLVEKFGEYTSSEKSVNILKIYESFTMETILAIAFGREVNVQQGEADKLTEAANFLVSQETTLPIPLMSFLLGEFPFLAPLIVWLMRREWQGRGPILMHSTAISLVQARKAETGSSTQHNDMLQLMIDARTKDGGTAQGERKLTDQEIVGFSIGFLTGGYETISNTLAYTTYLLALNPSVQDRLHSEIEEYFEEKPDASPYDATHEIQYLDMVLNEALRLYPVAPRTWRESMKTIQINEVTIPEGTGVHIPIHLLHHIPEYWPEPEKFDPERFTPEEKAKRPQLAHMPFGWGPRNCIGMRFAILEVKMALTEVVRKYKFVQAPETEIPLETFLGLNMIAKNGVYLKISLWD